MPKVTPEYIEKKREMIVDAAIEVCKRKTLSSITLQDIIDESGLSQGGIYNFYANIDEILTAVLERIRQYPRMDEGAEKILLKYQGRIEDARAIKDMNQGRKERRTLIKEIAIEYHQFMADSMKKYLLPYLKIEFEYGILITDFPERAKNIYSAIKRPFHFKTSIDRLCCEFRKEIEYGSIKPLVSLENYFEFNAAVYDGILKNALMRSCYERGVKGNAEYLYDINARFQTMLLTTCHLLGLNE